MTATQDGDSAREQPGQQAPIEDLVRLEGALHLLRFSLDRFIRAGFKPAPEYLRDLLDRVTEDPGEPCDRGRQYARAEEAEATIARVRAESARIRSITRTWGPVADLIDAALNDPERPRGQRMRPAHPDGTPYSYAEIAAEGWGFCDACRMWSTGTPKRPHQCDGPRLLDRGLCDEEQGEEVHALGIDEGPEWRP